MEKEQNKDLKDVLKAFGVILLYIFLSSFAIEFLLLFNINYNNLTNIIKQIYLTIYEILITLIIVYIYRKDFITNFKNFKKNFKNYIDKYMRYWYLILILMFISNSIITLFTTNSTSVNQQTIIDYLKTMPIYILITTSITAPIMEELVFRLSFKKIFKHTNILFIFFSGFIFGLMHVITSLTCLSDLLFIIPYSIPGFVFAYIYTKSKNIFVPISIHMIHNTVMLFLQIILIIK